MTLMSTGPCVYSSLQYLIWHAVALEGCLETFTRKFLRTTLLVLLEWSHNRNTRASMMRAGRLLARQEPKECRPCAYKYNTSRSSCLCVAQPALSLARARSLRAWAASSTAVQQASLLARPRRAERTRILPIRRKRRGVGGRDVPRPEVDILRKVNCARYCTLQPLAARTDTRYSFRVPRGTGS